MDKVLREQKRALAPLGYEYMGKRHSAGGSSGGGRGHHVFRHADGHVLVAPSTPTNPGRSLAMTLSRAKRADKARESVAEQWRQFLRDQFGVGDTEEKVVEWSEQEMREKFKRAHPELAERVTDSLFSVAIGGSDLFEVVEKGYGGRPGFVRKGKLLIRGPLAGLVRDDDGESSAQTTPAPEDMCGSTHQLESGGYAVCTRPRGHDGRHYDQYRNTRWAEEMEADGVVAAGGERPDEPVPAAVGVGEPAATPGGARPVAASVGSERAADSGEQAAARREPVVAAPVAPAGIGLGEGVRLGEGLVAQLIDALAGDLRAENDLLRGAIATAAAQLAEVSRELAAALDLGAGSAQTDQRGSDILGPRRLGIYRQLRTLPLPDPFTAGEAVAILAENGIDYGVNAVTSMLSELAKVGAVTRHRRGVYSWAE